MYKPLKDYMIVKRWVDKSSLIHIASDLKEDDVFEVIDVGPGIDGETPDVQPGDLVAIVGYLNHVKFKGETVTLARAKDAIVVLNPRTLVEKVYTDEPGAGDH